MPSFWLQDAKKAQHASHNNKVLPESADVVVIGGGYTGVSTAYWLCKNGVKNVVVLEQREYLSGAATGRNGGHLWPGTDKPLTEEAAIVGEDQAVKLWKFSLHNVDLVEKFVRDNKIECEMRMNGSVVLAVSKQQDKDAKLRENETNNEEMATIKKQYEFLKTKGLANDMVLWDRKKCSEEMKNDLFCGGLYTKRAAQLWPAKLVWGVAEKAAQLGAKFYTNVEVLSSNFSSSEKMHVVKTAVGTMKAKYVVFATNAYTGKVLPQYAKTIVPVRGQVVSSSPLPMQYPYGYLANSGYEYWNQQPDGRIVLGGMRWKSADQEVGTFDDTIIQGDVSKGLHDFLKKLYPGHNVKVEREWTGIMGFSSDNKPLVGPVPGMPNAFVAAGFTGHGMPLIFGCAEAIAHSISNNTEKMPGNFPECLLPSRFNLKAKL